MLFFDFPACSLCQLPTPADQQKARPLELIEPEDILPAAYVAFFPWLCKETAESVMTNMDITRGKLHTGPMAKKCRRHHDKQPSGELAGMQDA